MFDMLDMELRLEKKKELSSWSLTDMGFLRSNGSRQCGTNYSAILRIFSWNLHLDLGSRYFFRISFSFTTIFRLPQWTLKISIFICNILKVVWLIWIDSTNFIINYNLCETKLYFDICFRNICDECWLLKPLTKPWLYY